GDRTEERREPGGGRKTRPARQLIGADIPGRRDTLADLSNRYRDTPMAGRTHLQQALPVTFGYKTAIWLAMFDRHAERLAQLKPRVLVGQFAGAAGTPAPPGGKGLSGQEALCGGPRPFVPLAPLPVSRARLSRG